MDLEISPEPTRREREVLEVVIVAQANGDAPAEAWWAAGVREAVGDEDEP